MIIGMEWKGDGDSWWGCTMEMQGKNYNAKTL